MTQNTQKNLSRLVKELIDNKEIDDNTNNLVELKTLLSSANNKQLEEVLNEINVNQFCTELNSFEDKRNIDLIVSIFNVVFGTLSPQFVLNKFPKEILKGLDAKHEKIVDLWLKTLDRCLAEELAANHPISNDLDIHQILLKVVKLMSRPKTETGKYCHSIALNIAKSNSLGEKFFDKEVQNVVISIKSVDSIIRMRVYELLVAVGNTSHKNFAKVESFGHLKALLEDLNKDSTDDPLVTLNLLEVMKDLGSTPYGTQYLMNCGILPTIVENMKTNESDVFGHLLVPGYIKLFGVLSSNEPNILEKFPKVLKRLRDSLKDSDQNIQLTALDAIAIICRKNSGKVIVNKEENLPKTYMSTISAFILSGRQELKTRALVALSILLKVEESDPQNIGTSFAEKWFRLLLNNNRLTTLIGLCREPFHDIKLSALECIRVVATHLWGQKELAASGGFLEYILDRSTETTKQGKEAKYSVVRELVRSPFINQSFTKEAVIQLKAYDKEGPYYLTHETAVSFETN